MTSLLNPYCLNWLAGNKVPMAPKKMVAQSSDLQVRGTFTSLLDLLMVCSPILAFFLRCSLLGTSAGCCGPGREVSKGEVGALGGRRNDTQALGYLLTFSTVIHSPGSQFFLRISVLQEQQLGMKKCCCLEDISYKYNLTSSASLQVQFTRPRGF